jgi:hypothetical protein
MRVQSTCIFVGFHSFMRLHGAIMSTLFDFHWHRNVAIMGQHLDVKLKPLTNLTFFMTSCQIDYDDVFLPIKDEIVTSAVSWFKVRRSCAIRQPHSLAAVQ